MAKTKELIVTVAVVGFSTVLALVVGSLIWYWASSTEEASAVDPTPPEVAYTLTWQDISYDDRNLTRSLIANAFSDDTGGTDDHIVLSSDQPVEGCTYIKAHCPYSVEREVMVVEVGITHADGSSACYSYETKSRQEALDIFIDYWKNQKIPDVEKWQSAGTEVIEQ